MEVKYQVVCNGTFFIHKFNGLFSLKTYIKYARKVLRKLNSKTINKVLIDFRDMQFGVNTKDFINDLEKMTKVREKIDKKQNKRSDMLIVFLVDKPLPTVIANIFKKKFSNVNYNYCSTSKGVNMIFQMHDNQYDLDQYELESLINSLENTFPK